MRTNAKFKIVERTYNVGLYIRSTTGAIELMEVVASGCGSMNAVEKAVLKWCWSRGTPGRITYIERIDPEDEPKRKEFPTGA